MKSLLSHLEGESHKVVMDTIQSGWKKNKVTTEEKYHFSQKKKSRGLFEREKGKRKNKKKKGGGGEKIGPKKSVFNVLKAGYGTRDGQGIQKKIQELSWVETKKD